MEYMNYKNNNNFDNPYCCNNMNIHRNYQNNCYMKNKDCLKDYGPNPLIINIEEATKVNDNFRLALWTGEYFQITLMSIDVGESIGLETHPNLDQFIRIEQGTGLVEMGNCKNHLHIKRIVCDGYAIVIPAGKWHNLTNIGNVPIKLYSIYAPPNHEKGTIHINKEDDRH